MCFAKWSSVINLDLFWKQSFLIMPYWIFSQSFQWWTFPSMLVSWWTISWSKSSIETSSSPSFLPGNCPSSAECSGQLSPQISKIHRMSKEPSDMSFKVAGVKVCLIQTWNFRSHAVSVCISLWCHRPMHAVTVRALVFWFCLIYTFIPATFMSFQMHSLDVRNITNFVLHYF